MRAALRCRIPKECPMVKMLNLGVVGVISPWNLPLYLLTWKIAPAIACGNCVVAKPSELTSWTAYLLSQVIKEVLPPGVVNIVPSRLIKVYGTGRKAGEAIVQHSNIKCISFTGGTATGKRIMEKAAPFIKNVSLELGGKNAAVIFEDALQYSSQENFDLIQSLIKSSFFNQGEVCLCTSRIFIHAKIYEEFKKRFIEQVKQIAVGDPFDAKTAMGPLVSKEHLMKVRGYVELAKKEGGVIIHPRESNLHLTAVDASNIPSNGFYMQPTVIEGLQCNSRCMQEEIFGPVVCLNSFESEEEGRPD
jgi:acyl-CoA reductase-like NAD-dependent aldehyde dehydrogenase